MPVDQKRARFFSDWLKRAVIATYGELPHGYQTQLAETSGVSRETISGIMRGDRVPNEATVEKLAAALRVQPPAMGGVPQGPLRVKPSALIVAEPQAPGYGRTRPPVEPATPSLSPDELRVIADVAARAVHRTIEESELHTGRDGYFLVREALAAFADRLLELGVDRGYVAELYAAIAEISRLEHRRPDGPDLPPPPNDTSSGGSQT